MTPLGADYQPPDFHNAPADIRQVLADMRPRHRAFVYEYPRDFNGTAAAIRAGYAPSFAGQAAYRLIKVHQIRWALAWLSARALERAEVELADIVRELAAMGFTRLTEVASWDAGGRVTLVPSDQLTTAAAALRRVRETTKVRRDRDGVEIETRQLDVWLADKAKPLELLGRYVNLFEQHQRSGAARIAYIVGAPPAGLLKEPAPELGRSLDMLPAVAKDEE